MIEKLLQTSIYLGFIVIMVSVVWYWASINVTGYSNENLGTTYYTISRKINYWTHITGLVGGIMIVVPLMIWVFLSIWS